jgi:hypothetical protein
MVMNSELVGGQEDARSIKNSAGHSARVAHRFSAHGRTGLPLKLGKVIVSITKVRDLGTGVGYVISDTAGDMISVLGTKDGFGNLETVTGAMYADASGNVTAVELGPDGLPSRVVINSQVYDLGNYTDSTVIVSSMIDGELRREVLSLSSVMESVNALRALKNTNGSLFGGNSTATKDRVDPLIAAQSGNFAEFREGVLRPTLGIMGHVMGIASCLGTLFPEPATTVLTAVGCGSYLANQASRWFDGEDNDFARNTSTAADIVECGASAGRQCDGLILDIMELALDVSAALDNTPVIPATGPPIIPPVEFCPPGTSLSSDGVCRTPEGCPAELPFLWGDGLCRGFAEPICPSGTSLASDGVCRTPEGCAAEVPFLWRDGFCRSFPEPSCPPGTTLAFDGVCRTPEGCAAEVPFLWSDGFCHATPEPSTGCSPGYFPAFNAPQVCCPSGYPYLWGDDRCHTSSPQGVGCPPRVTGCRVPAHRSISA